MSLAIPSQLRGKQLENFNKAQSAISNIRTPAQPFSSSSAQSSMLSPRQQASSAATIGSLNAATSSARTQSGSIASGKQVSFNISGETSPKSVKSSATVANKNSSATTSTTIGTGIASADIKSNQEPFDPQFPISQTPISWSSLQPKQQQQQQQQQKQLVQFSNETTGVHDSQQKSTPNLFGKKLASNTTTAPSNIGQQKATQSSSILTPDIRQLVSQSDIALRNLEDQFKSLNSKDQHSTQSQQNRLAQNNTANNSAGASSSSSGNMNQLKSDIDRLIQQAQQQSKPSLTPYQLNEDQQYDSIRRDNSLANRLKIQDDKSSKKSKRSESKKHKRKSKSKSKKNRHRSSSSDSSRSSSRSQSQSSSSSSSSRSSSRDSRNGNRSKKHQKKKATSRNDNAAASIERSESHYSRYQKAVSTKSERQSKSALSVTNARTKEKGPLKHVQELSVISSSSSKFKQLNVTTGNAVKPAAPSVSGFRRCPDDDDDEDDEDMEQNTYDQNENYRGGVRVDNYNNRGASTNQPPLLHFSNHDDDDDDDAFDIKDYFKNPNQRAKDNNNRSLSKKKRAASINGAEEYMSKRSTENNSRMQHQLQEKRPLANPKRIEEDSDDVYLRKRFDENKHESQKQRLMNLHSDNVSMSIRTGTSKHTGAQQQQRQFDSRKGENISNNNTGCDNLIFCINCEEYIKIDKVDEHSNVCQSLKEQNRLSNRNQNQNSASSTTKSADETTSGKIQNLNEKLIKIRFLIKNRFVHLQATNDSYQNEFDQSTFEDLMSITNASIEEHRNPLNLQEQETQIRVINAELIRSQSESAHHLLYLTQKLGEFISRKRVFLDRYGGDAVNQFEKQDQNQQNRLHHQREVSDFDVSSIASGSNYRATGTRQRSALQNNRKDPIQIFARVNQDTSNIQRNNNNNDSINTNNRNIENIKNINKNTIFQQQKQFFQQQQQVQSQNQQLLLGFNPQQQSMGQRNISQIDRFKENVNVTVVQSPALVPEQPVIQQRMRGMSTNTSSNPQQQQQPYSLFLRQPQQPMPQQRITQANLSSTPFQIRPLGSQENMQQKQSVENTNQNLKPYLQNTEMVTAPAFDERNRMQSAHLPQRRFERTANNQPFLQQKEQITDDDIFEVQSVQVVEQQLIAPSLNQNQYQVNAIASNAQLTNNQQMSLEESEREKQTKAMKQRFFLLANNLKKYYPNSNKFLIADLWKDAAENQITDDHWTTFLTQKFSS